jgi:2-polyprenyl-6-methoxyphenol hydroxylase-like FAD-dependent oxidoreductase
MSSSFDFQHSYDVLIAGAGVAGAAAALQAARMGLRTALIEKTVLLGGLATTGLIYIYLPLCDGRGRQVTFGIAEELLHLSIKYGPGDVPAGWREPGEHAERGRYRVAFSPASFILALDEALEQAGVTLWLDTLVCRPVMEGDRITGVAVENKSGRGLLTAACVVDATGDADVAFRAGAPCALGDNWLSLWALQASLEHAERAVRAPDSASLLDVIRVGADNAGRGAPAGCPKFDGTDAQQVTEFVLAGRRLLREHYAARQAEGGPADRRTLFPVTLPAMAQFRTTRRILGREQMTDGQHGRHRPTSIGLVADWRKAGYVWEIPFGALLPQGVSGLLVAGRCIASEGDAWEVTRVIPPAALTGQAAGLAAGLAIQQGTTPDRLEIATIQRELDRLGISYHLA